MNTLNGRSRVLAELRNRRFVHVKAIGYLRLAPAACFFGGMIGSSR
jgi:hypothetical protein